MKITSLLLMAMVSAGTSFAADSFIIAERGEMSRRVIAIKCNGGDGSVTMAAEELQRYVARMTDVELKIVEHGWWKFWTTIEDEKLPHVCLLVDESRGDLGDEGFELRVTGCELDVIGRSGRGVLFGVYELLERYGGCGWYTSWHEVVPKLDVFAVPADLDDVQRPAFRSRELSWYDVVRHPEFARRNRVSSGDECKFDPVLGKCHTFANLLSPEELFDEHPEYFSEVNGKRRKVYTQLCLTNPEVVRLCTEKVLERIDETCEDGVRYYGVSQNDWSGHCTCADCRAIDEREGSPSGTLVAFVNQIAEAVEKKHPDVFIETLVYTYTRRPPKTLSFRRNVIPCFCTIECDFSKPIALSRAAENRAVGEAIREWSWKSGQLMVWDYTTDFFHYLLVWPNAKSLASNLRLFRDAGASMVLEQGNGDGAHGDWAELKAWMLMKLMWNPYQDERALIDRYFAAVYGPAAPEMRAYFELVHSQRRDEAAMPMRCFDLPERCHISQATLDEAAALVSRAANKVALPGLEAYATNVACSRLSLDYTRAIRGYGRFRLRRNAQDVNPREFLEEREGARRILAAKDVVLSQGNDPFAAVFLERFAASEVPTNGVERVFVSAKSFWRAGIGDSAAEFVEDAATTDGVALKLKNSTFGWVGYFNFGMVDFEPGAKVRVRARIRIAGKDRGEAFSAGIWSLKDRKYPIPPMSGSFDGILNEDYVWYEIGEWVPGEREFFWIAPGKFADDETRGGHYDVRLDGLELTLCNR